MMSRKPAAFQLIIPRFLQTSYTLYPVIKRM